MNHHEGERSRPLPSGDPSLRPFQFSIATLLAIVAVYAFLFGVLRCLEVRSYSLFFAVVIALTTIAFSQWGLFGGRSPSGASFLVGGLLSIAGMMAMAPHSMEMRDVLCDGNPWILVRFLTGMLGGTFLLGGLLGFGLGGLVDIALLFIESVGGIPRKVFINPPRLLDAVHSDRHAEVRKRGRMMRRMVLLLLVALFFVAVLAIPIEQSWRSR